MSETLSIRNMVCPRCIAAVENLLDSASIPYSRVELGIAHLPQALTPQQHQQLSASLTQQGFELLEESEQKRINEVKARLISVVFHGEIPNGNISEWLSKELGREYTSLSRLFSSLEGKTIEKYYLQLKIERAKELISYNEKSFSEIADMLHYSSVAHFSSQFKRETGMTPSAFKKDLEKDKRTTIDRI